MKVRVLIWFVTIMFISSCELLPSDKQKSAKKAIHLSICVWSESNEQQENDCDLDPWLRYWAAVENESWPQRKKLIDELSDNRTDLFKKVLLSQGKGTPYQSRLRAKIWLEALLPKFSKEMSDFILVALYQPSVELLELESAIVTLSKLTTRQDTKLVEQQLLLDKQSTQIEQLLSIETSIMESKQKDNK